MFFFVFVFKYFPLDSLRDEVDALFSICTFSFSRIINIAFNERWGTIYIFLSFLLSFELIGFLLPQKVITDHADLKMWF